MIRQAISCDICATEKKQTNHWFVAYDHGGELRVSGWSSRNRLRPGAKHLCGQTCLHKLVDDFMARDLLVRVQPGVAEETAAAAQVVATAVVQSADAAMPEVESSARLVTAPVPALSKRPLFRAQPEPSAAAVSQLVEELALTPDEPPRDAARNLRAEAWQRERERTLHSVELHSDSAARRRARS